MAIKPFLILSEAQRSDEDLSLMAIKPFLILSEA